MVLESFNFSHTLLFLVFLLVVALFLCPFESQFDQSRSVSIMSIFDAYDTEFTSLSQDISRNIGDLKQNLTNAGEDMLHIYICDYFLYFTDIVASRNDIVFLLYRKMCFN